MNTTRDNDTIMVVDPDGGTWAPSEEAAEEINAADDPAAKAIEICESAPTRGEWHQ